MQLYRAHRNPDHAHPGAPGAAAGADPALGNSGSGEDPGRVSGSGEPLRVGG